jgi:hypothetical protein
MKKLITIGAVALLLTVSMVGATQATVTYDFSAMGFSDGQDVEPLSLDSLVITGEASVIYQTLYGVGIGSSNAGAGGIGIGNTGDLYLTFSKPIDYISVTSGNGAGDSDAFSLYLYEFGTNNFLGRYDSPVFGGASEPQWYTLSVSASNVGYVLWDPGNSGSLPGDSSGQGGVVMTDLSYNVIPAPGAILLGGIGVAVVGWLRRRRAL